jgi:predicted NAD/FAD-dependent oxidoreductase
LIFDHAAQFFTVNDSRFAELVNAWLDNGLVREWKGTVGELHNGGEFLPFLPSPPRYIATNGMRVLADSLLSEVVPHYHAHSSLFLTIEYSQL